MSRPKSGFAPGVAGWAIASNFAFGVVGMVLIGWVLERFVWPKASPWIIIGFACAGLIGGGHRFVKEAMAANRQYARSKR